MTGTAVAWIVIGIVIGFVWRAFVPEYRGYRRPDVDDYS